MKPTPIKYALLCLAALITVGVGFYAFAFQKTSYPLQAGLAVTHIIVEKSQHQLKLYAGDEPLRTYSIALGRGGLEPKLFQGDKRTPEGKYHIDFRKERSGYHRALHISYPDSADRQRASDAGKDPGGDIMIHGIRNGLGWIGRFHTLFDWTAGCIAVTDDEIEEIWNLAKDGTPVEIKS